MFPLQNKAVRRQRYNKAPVKLIPYLDLLVSTGRFMVAVRDITALETILVERAAASGPKLAHPAVCVECLASVDTR